MTTTQKYWKLDSEHTGIQAISTDHMSAYFTMPVEFCVEIPAAAATPFIRWDPYRARVSKVTYSKDLEVKGRMLLVKSIKGQPLRHRSAIGDPHAAVSIVQIGIFLSAAAPSQHIGPV